MVAGGAGKPWIAGEVCLGASRIPVFLNFTKLHVCAFCSESGESRCVDYGYLLEGNGNNQTMKQNSDEKLATLEGLGKEQLMVCPDQHFSSGRPVSHLTPLIMLWFSWCISVTLKLSAFQMKGNHNMYSSRNELKLLQLLMGIQSKRQVWALSEESLMKHSVDTVWMHQDHLILSTDLHILSCVMRQCIHNLYNKLLQKNN